MTIASELYDYSVENAWANPAADRQFLIEPNRLTSYRGTLGPFTIPGATYGVPSTDTRWVLYTFGNMFPDILGIDESLMNWETLEDVMSRNKVLILPTLDQLAINPSDVQIIRMESGGILFAHRYDHYKKRITSDSVFRVRFYSNAYFSTDDGAELEGIISSSVYLTEAQDGPSLISAFEATNMVESGLVYWYHNGFYVENPSSETYLAGDTLSYIWDSAGIRYFDVQIDEMSSFTSTKDGITKGLLFSPEYMSRNFIFFDDMDFYVCAPNLDETNNVGIFYDRVSASQLRQVARSDWSLNISRVNTLVTAQADTMSSEGIFIRVFLRHNVNPSADISDGNYLFDLYMMDKADRYEVMTGGVSSRTDWQAATLENSSFINWMGLAAADLSTDEVAGVLNHYGAQKALQIPTLVDTGTWDLPYMARSGGLVVELNDDGEMLGYTVVSSSDSSSYDAQYGGTQILLYCGTAITTATQLDISIDQSNDTIGIYDETRFILNLAGTTWTECTYGTEYSWSSGDSALTWAASTTNRTCAKRSSGSFVIRNFTIKYSQIGNGFNIFSDGSTPTTGIDFGMVHLWVSSESGIYKRGIYGLDYTFEDFKVYITSREFIQTGDDVTADTELTIFMIACGLPQDTENGQYGFVIDQLVNLNDTVDLVRGRNYNCFIQGNYIADPTTDVYLAELYRGDYTIEPTSLAITDWQSGKSYAEGVIVRNRYALYCAPSGGVVKRSVFTASDWQRVWSTAYYKLHDSTVTPIVTVTAAGTDGSVTLTWNQADDSTTIHYYIMRGTVEDETQWTKLATVNSTTLTYTDDTVTNGKKYYYWIRVVDEDATVLIANPVSITPSASSDSTNTVTTDKPVYVTLYEIDGYLYYQVAEEDGVQYTYGEQGAVTLSMSFTTVRGLPTANTHETGQAYIFSNTPNVLSRFTVGQFVDTYAEAKETTSDIADLLTTIYPQYQPSGVTTSSNVYTIVSPFMWAIKTALDSGDISLTQTSISKTFADNLTKDYQDLLDMDPCYNSDNDFTYLACHAHGQPTALAVSAPAMTLLSKCNELFFDNRILVSADFYIDTSL